MELPYFYVDNMYGFDQGRFYDFWMHLGGCAAVTACDLSIYLASYAGMEQLYPYPLDRLKRRDYLRFSKEMKPYLRPRKGGVSRLSMYTEGFGRYLRDHGGRSLRGKLFGFAGEHSVGEAAEVLREQLLRGIPVPCLTLKHADPAYDDYVWHWFLLTGIRQAGAQEMTHACDIPAPSGGLEVKLVTYGTWRWVDFARLWNTGYAEKGGLILLREVTAPKAIALTAQDAAAAEDADKAAGTGETCVPLQR